MANVFKATRQIVEEMCADFKVLTGITLTPDQIDDSNVIKFWTDAGAISSFYSELQRSVNDFFPVSASEEGLEKHLSTRSLAARIQPQKSHGQIEFTTTDSATTTSGVTQVKRRSDGAIFQAIESVARVGAGSLVAFFESIETGNAQNLDDTNQPFDLITPITNVQTACVNSSQFLDGRDLETPAEMLVRIQTHDQDDNTGGNAVAYETWAFEASAEVVTARVLRLVRGPDTVDTVITSGTSDIEAAVEAGQPVTRIPSVALIAAVQAYIVARNPVTDDHLTRAPAELSFDSTVKYTLFDETAANRAFVDSVIEKVWKTYVYQARSTDRLSPTDLERLIDKRIGDQIKEREVEDFHMSHTYYDVPNDKILTPGTLTMSTF